MNLALRYLFGNGYLHPGHLLDIATRIRAAGPIGANQHGRAVTVLAVNEQILVTEQVNQRQHLGKQGNQQHQQNGAGKKATRE